MKSSTDNQFKGVAALYTANVAPLRRLLRRLAADQPALAGLSPAMLRSPCVPKADVVLRALIVAATSSDCERERGAAVAGILLALQPGMNGLVRRLRRWPWISPDDVVAEVCYGIVVYPLHRQERVAANLLLDALQRLTTRGIHRDHFRTTTTSLDAPERPSDTHLPLDTHLLGTDPIGEVETRLMIEQSWPCPPGRDPDRHQRCQLMLARVAAGESATDIATSDGLAVGTAWQRMHDARRHFRNDDTRSWLQAA